MSTRATTASRPGTDTSALPTIVRVRPLACGSAAPAASASTAAEIRAGMRDRSFIVCSFQVGSRGRDLLLPFTNGVTSARPERLCSPGRRRSPEGLPMLLVGTRPAAKALRALALLAAAVAADGAHAYCFS